MSTTGAIVQPPINLACAVLERVAYLSWERSASRVDGYRVYRNGTLIDTISSVNPIFEFPFPTTEGTGDTFEISDISSYECSDYIQPFVQHTYSVTAFADGVESTAAIITAYYESNLMVRSVVMEPNPVLTDGSLIITVDVIEEVVVTIN